MSFSSLAGRNRHYFQLFAIPVTVFFALDGLVADVYVLISACWILFRLQELSLGSLPPLLARYFLEIPATLLFPDTHSVLSF